MRLLKLFGITGVVFLLINCNKSEQEIFRTYFILAGQGICNVQLKVFEPALQVALMNESVNGIPTTVFSGDVQLDLDEDGESDLNIHSFYGLGHPMSHVTPSEGCKLSEHSMEKEIAACFQPLHGNDTINSNLTWTNLSLEEYLASYTPEWTNTDEIKYNPWEGSGLFLPLRVIESNDTCFGWIELKIEEYYKLTIRSFGLQK